MTAVRKNHTSLFRFRKSSLPLALLLALILVLPACQDSNQSTEMLRGELAELRQDVHRLQGLELEVARLSAELHNLTSTLPSENQRESLGKNTADQSKIASLTPQGNENSAEIESAEQPIENGDISAFNDDPFIGSKDASVIGIVFLDFQGKSSKLLYNSALAQLREDFSSNPQVKFIFADYPLEKNLQARSAAHIANCAGEQGLYWDVFNRLFSGEIILKNDKWDEVMAQLAGKTVDLKKLKRCFYSGRYNKEITKDRDAAKLLGAQGSPSIVIGKLQPNGKIIGKLIRGAQPYPFIKTSVKKLLTTPD